MAVKVAFIRFSTFVTVTLQSFVLRPSFGSAVDGPKMEKAEPRASYSEYNYKYTFEFLRYTGLKFGLKST